jgi:hypothetical protein
VILDDDWAASYPARLSEKLQGMSGVMEYVDEHDGVDAAIGVREVTAVERLNGDARTWTRENIEARDRQARPEPADFRGELSIAAPDVHEHASVRQEGDEKAGENADAPRVNHGPVERADGVHRV